MRHIAEALDVSPSSVSEWLAIARKRGPAALRSRPHPGAPPKLTSDQRQLIVDFLWHGAEAYGFRGDVWTSARIAQVLEQEFGVSYHAHHVAKILKQLDWTPQVPITRAIQRDEVAIAHWQQETWPGLLSKARREDRVVIFEDESGFYLLPGLVRTYAPKGLTPIIYEWQTRDHLSVMGGITCDGKVFTLARQESLNGLHSIAFLEHLLRHAGERLLVIWDRSPIHRRKEVQSFVEHVGKKKLWVEFLPAYAPDLNPTEWLWRRLKDVDLRNLTCLDLEEVHQNFHLAIGRIRHRAGLVRAFFKSAGLTL